MKNQIYYFLFAVYIFVLFLALQRDIILEYEWLLIMENSTFESGLRIYDRPTAYMPPLYPYYLLIIRLFLSFTDWIKVSVAIQSIVYFISVYYLFKTFLNSAIRKPAVLILFCLIIFFPPIFVGNTSVSSFALSVSVFCVFFALLFRIYEAPKTANKNIIYLILVSVVGLHLRYEFIYILILMGFIFLVLRRIRFLSFLAVFLFVFLSYLPWTFRNYKEIGKFSYATSLSYNFAKGYNENYNIFSTYNFPFSAETNEKLGIDVLYAKFRSEKEIDEYLSMISRDLVTEKPSLFIKLTLQKLGINLVQYFPDYNGISRYGIYFFYSTFFVLFQGLLIYSIKKMHEKKQKYLFAFTLSLYLFFLTFYSIAPMPRYLLLFFPMFAVLIIKTFTPEVNFRKVP